MKVSEMILAAHDSLTSENWGQGKYFQVGPKGNVCMCAHGALQAQENERVRMALRDLGRSSPTAAEQAATSATAMAAVAADEASAAAAAAAAWKAAPAAGAAAAATKAAWKAAPTARAAAASKMGTASIRPDWAPITSWYAGMVGLTPSYNDEPERTVEEVRAKLLAAAKLAATHEAAGIL